jgi:uncharacterized phage protein (TIGR01671 family)
MLEARQLDVEMAWYNSECLRHLKCWDWRKRMNRIVKFRGKRLDNGEWVYGDLIQYEDKNYAIFSKPLSKYGYEATEICKRDAVDPSTVGEFTDLKDKNGKEIFEGDHISYYRVTNQCEGIIKFGEYEQDGSGGEYESTTCVGFYIKQLKIILNERETEEDVYDPEYYKEVSLKDGGITEILIIDNPELLKQEDL